MVILHVDLKKKRTKIDHIIEVNNVVKSLMHENQNVTRIIKQLLIFAY